MIAGNDAKLLLNKHGDIIALATGSDPSTEHEGGSQRLMSLLCNQAQADHETIARLNSGPTTIGKLKERLTGNPEPIKYPALLESKRIVKNPPQLGFLEQDGDQPEAILFCARTPPGFDHPELRFRDRFAGKSDRNCAGAWDDQSFAFRVRGKGYVRALRAFYHAILNQKVVFAGTFLRKKDWRNQLAGVILANLDHLTKEDKADIQNAQAEYESNLRLKARDDSRELFQEMQEVSGSNRLGGPGHIWVRWKDDAESDVVYCLNPGYQVKADYLGPYTRTELLIWASHKYNYHLSPSAALPKRAA